ncbi:cell division protein FtsB [Fibrobacter sp. UWH9]|nr:Cell division protein FtsB [Fibrobacter succinogenes]SHG34474.1 cell division protein FtsB [Fibrobacter sp. UWH9]SHK14318.1 cell division protein FtsB [Fibrobacter sp. UWH6]SHK31083.1 cell division protein FtsB [Fibrobacter sp. UWH5]
MSLKKHLVILALFIFAIIVVAQMMFGKNSIRQQRRINREIASYQHQIDSLQMVIDKRKVQIQQLKTDSLYKEGLLRTRYGMSRKGEVVFQLVE